MHELRRASVSRAADKVFLNTITSGTRSFPTENNSVRQLPETQHTHAAGAAALCMILTLPSRTTAVAVGPLR